MFIEPNSPFFTGYLLKIRQLLVESMSIQPHLGVILFNNLLDRSHLLVKYAEHVGMLLGIEFSLLRSLPLDLKFFLLSLKFLVLCLNGSVLYRSHVILELLVVF